jgi:hypothetical protein
MHEFTVERSLMNVNNVGEPSIHPSTLKDIHKLALEQNLHMLAVVNPPSVECPSKT